MQNSNPLETIWAHMEIVFHATAAEIVRRDGQFPEVKLRDGDVVVAGHVKTGTTWLQQILHQIRTKGDTSFTEIYNVSPWIPYHHQLMTDFDPNVPAQPWTPRVFKDHETYEWIPGKADGARYVAIARDPVDAMWSFAKFIIPFLTGVHAELSADDIIRFLKSPQFANGNGCHDWLVSWFPHRNDPNVLWLHYEDLIEDLPFCVGEITKFIGVSLSPSELATVLEHSSHAFMVEHKAQFMGNDELHRRMFKALQMEFRPAMGMVRPEGGNVGDGKRSMPDAVQKYLREEWEATVGSSLGYHSYAELRAQSSLLQRRKH